MNKLTQERIERLAEEIYSWLNEHEMDDAICIYYGHKRIDTHKGHKIIEENVEAKDYCECAPYHNIITISSEGSLYDRYNHDYKMPSSLANLWEKLDLCCECNEYWNWSLYPSSDELEVEYPYREEEPEPPMYISLGCRERMGREYPKELDTVMQLWYDLGSRVGDQGCRVIGQKMTFNYEGKSYEMCPVTGWQGEYSWVKWVDLIKSVLSSLGATNIYWHCGRMD